MSNTNVANQAVAFVLALVLSIGAFGVTVAPDYNDAAPVASQLIA